MAAYRPTGKDRVERQVLIVRDHVLAGRAFSSTEEMDAAFMAWVPQRRARTHATHHEVIGLGPPAITRPSSRCRPAPFVLARWSTATVGPVAPSGCEGGASRVAFTLYVSVVPYAKEG
ncbi:hypothetical protein [Streptomyces sp. NBC_00285]|uniref:hypothetical protein n=1 Tax=Streptomyces sp. NBC_00285 TaxID=2975700 RepID=UPI003FA7AE23